MKKLFFPVILLYIFTIVQAQPPKHTSVAFTDALNMVNHYRESSRIKKPKTAVVDSFEVADLIDLIKDYKYAKFVLAAYPDDSAPEKKKLSDNIITTYQ